MQKCISIGGSVNNALILPDARVAAAPSNRFTITHGDTIYALAMIIAVLIERQVQVHETFQSSAALLEALLQKVTTKLQGGLERGPNGAPERLRLDECLCECSLKTPHETIYLPAGEMTSQLHYVLS